MTSAQKHAAAARIDWNFVEDAADRSNDPDLRELATVTGVLMLHTQIRLQDVEHEHGEIDLDDTTLEAVGA
jgi:protein tyrosine/serine phosphatase